MTRDEDNSSVSTALLVAGGIGCLLVVAVFGFLVLGFRASSFSAAPVPATAPSSAPVDTSEDAEPSEETEAEGEQGQPPSED